MDGNTASLTDFESGSKKLTIPMGKTSGMAYVNIKGDVVDEPDETFTLRLSNPSGQCRDRGRDRDRHDYRRRRPGAAARGAG